MRRRPSRRPPFAVVMAETAAAATRRSARPARLRTRLVCDSVSSAVAVTVSAHLAKSATLATDSFGPIVLPLVVAVGRRVGPFPRPLPSRSVLLVLPSALRTCRLSQPRLSSCARLRFGSCRHSRPRRAVPSYLFPSANSLDRRRYFDATTAPYRRPTDVAPPREVGCLLASRVRLCDRAARARTVLCVRAALRKPPFSPR